MAFFTCKTWESDGLSTEKLSIITKLTDLGAPISKKSLLGCYLNITIDTDISINNRADYYFTIRYRTGSRGGWKWLHTFARKKPINSNNNIYVEKIFTSSIKNISNVQLRIGGELSSGIGLNDFGLLYRVYRDTSIETHDED
mgnify:CR=1 FL=1